MSAPTLSCRVCNGKGRVSLPPALLETYHAICKLGNPTIPEVHAHLHATCQSGANKRVRRLLALGFVNPIKQAGKVTRYTASP